LRKRSLTSSYLLECSGSGGISVNFRVGEFYWNLSMKCKCIENGTKLMVQLCEVQRNLFITFHLILLWFTNVCRKSCREIETEINCTWNTFSKKLYFYGINSRNTTQQDRPQTYVSTYKFLKCDVIIKWLSFPNMESIFLLSARYSSAFGCKVMALSP
jgi:hypothetical protein